MRKKSYWNKLAVAAITTVVLLQGHLAPAEALASESQESKENLNTTEVKEETSEEEIVEIKEDSQEDSDLDGEGNSGAEEESDEKEDSDTEEGSKEDEDSDKKEDSQGEEGSDMEDDSEGKDDDSDVKDDSQNGDDSQTEEESKEDDSIKGDSEDKESSKKEKIEGETEEKLPGQEDAETFKTDFFYENGEVVITATASPEAKLPQNTEMRAVKLAEGSAEYEEAKAASASGFGTDENAVYTFYDVTFVVDGVQAEPAKGIVSVQVQFKNVQVSGETDKQLVLHIEDTENGKLVEDVTASAEEGNSMYSVDFAI